MTKRKDHITTQEITSTNKQQKLSITYEKDQYTLWQIIGYWELVALPMALLPVLLFSALVNIGFSGYLYAPIARLLPVMDMPVYAVVSQPAGPQFTGQWWILGITLISMAFNYFLGRELGHHAPLIFVGRNFPSVDHPAICQQGTYRWTSELDGFRRILTGRNAGLRLSMR